MYCKHCGSSLPDDARFCPSCGSNVQEERKNADQPCFNQTSFDSTPISETPTIENAEPVKKFPTLGLIGFILSCSSFIFLLSDLCIASSAGFIISLIALVQAKRKPINTYKLNGFAIAGVVIGAIGLVFFLFFIFYIVLYALALVSTLPFYIY